MVVQAQPSDGDFDLLSSYFVNLGELVRRFGTDDLVPFTTDWQSVGTDDDLEARVIMNADGSMQFQASFEDQLRIDVRADTTNTKVWQSIEKRYTQSGDMPMTIVVADNGVQREDFYENGSRVATRYTDLAGIMLWADVTNFYDEAGTRTEKLTHFDDGRQRQDIFEDGSRIQTIMSDFTDGNAHDWDTIVSDYNEFGVRTAKTTTYDDGSSRVETFANGVRIAEVRHDNGEEVWDEIETTYSIFGDLEARTITFDSGVERSEGYFNDALVHVLMTDVQDTMDWQTIDRSYDDAGFVDRSETLFDNGDITIFFYEDGLRDIRIELDVDDSEDWMYRVTHYDESGVVEVETYLQGDDFDWESISDDPEGPGDIGPPPELPIVIEDDFLM